MSKKSSVVAIYESHNQGIGIPKNSVLQYEKSLQAGKFLLILHGTSQEVERAKDRLDNTQAAETVIHAEPVAAGV
jgi:hypothetical protein